MEIDLLEIFVEVEAVLLKSIVSIGTAILNDS
jgi:hypothetical protein